MFAMYKDTLHPAAQRWAETRLATFVPRYTTKHPPCIYATVQTIKGTHSAIHPDIDVTMDLVSKICSRPHGCLYSPLRNPDCMQNKNGAFERCL